MLFAAFLRVNFKNFNTILFISQHGASVQTAVISREQDASSNSNALNSFFDMYGNIMTTCFILIDWNSSE